jgi:hypothetical protein
MDDREESRDVSELRFQNPGNSKAKGTLIQELKEKVRMQSTYSKAKVIAVSHRIHKSTKGNVWMVESSNGGFYKVEYIEGELMCEYPAFVYGMTSPCKHIISLAVKETS